jgi:hypothetical protein
MIDHGQDTDVLQPEPVRQGGLVQRDIGSPLLVHNVSHLGRIYTRSSNHPDRPLPYPSTGLYRTAPLPCRLWEYSVFVGVPCKHASQDSFESERLSIQSFQPASPCLFWSAVMRFAVMRFLDVFSLILSFLGFYAIVYSLRLLLPRNIVPPVLTALNEAMALLECDEAISIPNLGDYRANMATCAHT